MMKIAIKTGLLFILSTSFQCTSERGSMKKDKEMIVNDRKLFVIDQITIETKKDKFRFSFGTSDTSMLGCPDNLGMTIENLDKKIRIFSEGWGINGMSPEHNIYAKPQYVQSSTIGEKIYIHLGSSGCGSGYTYTAYELTGIDSENPKLNSFFTWSETSRIVYATSTGLIYVMTGLWEIGCHFGCDTKYDIQIYSMYNRKEIKHYQTNYKYPDVTNDISDEELFQMIISRENLL